MKALESRSVVLSYKDSISKEYYYSLQEVKICLPIYNMREMFLDAEKVPLPKTCQYLACRICSLVRGVSGKGSSTLECSTQGKRVRVYITNQYHV